MRPNSAHDGSNPSHPILSRRIPNDDEGLVPRAVPPTDAMPSKSRGSTITTKPAAVPSTYLGGLDLGLLDLGLSNFGSRHVGVCDVYLGLVKSVAAVPLACAVPVCWAILTPLPPSCSLRGRATHGGQGPQNEEGF